MKLFIAWILSLFLAFTAGIVFPRSLDGNEELKQKVTDHLDIIVDEAAGIVDDVSAAAEEKRESLKEDIQKTDEYKEAKEFADNVQEIAQNTAADIDDHFGTNLSGKEEAEGEDLPETSGEASAEQKSGE